jgi:hypothetical protein
VPEFFCRLVLTHFVRCVDEGQKKSNVAKLWEYAVKMATSKGEVQEHEGSTILQCWAEADVSEVKHLSNSRCGVLIVSLVLRSNCKITMK